MRSAVLVVGSSLTIAAALAAVAQSPVPVDQEPHHRLVFANRYVRVLDVTLEPGYVTLFHTHVINAPSHSQQEYCVRTNSLSMECRAKSP